MRYLSRDGNFQTQEYSINLAKNEERFYFGLCPVSLKTSSVQDPSSNQLNELKVTEIDWQRFDCKCCSIIAVPVKDYMFIWLKNQQKLIKIEFYKYLLRSNSYINFILFRLVLVACRFVIAIGKLNDKIGSVINRSVKYYNIQVMK